MTRAQFQDVCDLNALAREVMHAVGVVPIETEVRGCGLHRRQPLGDRIGIDRSRGIAVLGNAPHALDGCVLRHQAFDFIHVRTIFAECDRNHADAVALADGEVPVVAGNGTQERNLSLLGPGRGAVAGAFEQREGHGVMHQGETGVVGNDQLFSGRSDDPGK